MNGLRQFFSAGLAGIFFFSIFTRPGRAKAPGPRGASAFLISAANASNTAATSFLLKSVAVAMFVRISVFVGGFFGLAALAMVLTLRVGG